MCSLTLTSLNSEHSRKLSLRPEEGIRPNLEHHSLRVYYVRSAGTETEDQCAREDPSQWSSLYRQWPLVLPTTAWQPHWEQATKGDDSFSCFFAQGHRMGRCWHPVESGLSACICPGLPGHTGPSVTLLQRNTSAHLLRWYNGLRP